MMNYSAVRTEGLHVRRGGRDVLTDLSIEVPAGQVVGLLGPSGSGKTTLLRSIAGAQRIAGGTVTVLGEPAGTPALRRRIGYATQAGSVYACCAPRPATSTGCSPRWTCRRSRIASSRT
jgi:ABC-2 type transport system ATP-binding protein